MSGGERPIGAAKGKQSDTEALCQPPPPPLFQSNACAPPFRPSVGLRSSALRPLLPPPQKILQARRKGTSMDQVKVRRDRVAKYNRGQLPKEEMDAIKKKNEAKAKALSKEAMKGGLPLPMASFGMPEFDGGERFDLKGPYVDEGWVDENDEGPFGWLPWNKKKDQEDK